MSGQGQGGDGRTPPGGIFGASPGPQQPGAEQGQQGSNLGPFGQQGQQPGPGGAYGPPAQQGGFGQAPQQQGGFGQAPQQQGGFGQAPQQQGGFGQAPPQQQGGFGQAPPQQQGGFGQAPPQQAQGGFGQAPPSAGQGGYGQPLSPGGGFGGGGPQGGGSFGAPPGGGGYGQMPASVDAGDLLSTSMKVIGANLPAFAALTFGFLTPGVALSHFAQQRLSNQMMGVVQGMQDDPFAALRVFSGSSMFLILMGALVTFILSNLATAGLTYTTIEHLGGRSPSLSGALNRSVARVFPVMGVALLQALILFVLMIPTSFIMGIIGIIPILGILFICFVGFPGLLVGLLFFRATFIASVPVVVAEDLGPVSALQRSVNLTGGGNRFQIALALFALIAVYLVVLCVLTMDMGMASGGFDTATGQITPPSTLQSVFAFIFTLMIEGAVAMVTAAVNAVTYARLRGIRDGVDAAKLAEVFA